VLIAGLRTPAIACSVVVVGTSKDWGPENKLPELILEFAWCSLKASIKFSIMHAEKEFWCRLFPPLLLLVKASWTPFWPLSG
jgi:hypothetical protein